MPRIRTLKPEHKQHRKIGRLSDAHYRLWVGMLTETDDTGRLVADAEQLRALVWGYHPDVTAEVVEQRLRDLDAQGVIRLYTVNLTCYAVFPSFYDHQRLDKPQRSKLPIPPEDIVRECSKKGRRKIGERSQNARRGSNQGSDRTKDQGSDRRGGDRGGAQAPVGGVDNPPPPPADPGAAPPATPPGHGSAGSGDLESPRKRSINERVQELRRAEGKA